MITNELIDVLSGAEAQVRNAIYRYVDETPEKRVDIEGDEYFDERGDRVVVPAMTLRIDSGVCYVDTEDYRINDSLDRLAINEMQQIIYQLNN